MKSLRELYEKMDSSINTFIKNQDTAQLLFEIEYRITELLSIAPYYKYPHLDKGGELASHSVNVALLAVWLANSFGLTSEIKLLAKGCLLHDIGKTLIPDSIINKPGALTFEERVIMDQHALLGYERLSQVANCTSFYIVANHHLIFSSPTANSFPMFKETYFCGVADIIDAMLSSRPYKPRLDIKTAIVEVERKAGNLLTNNLEILISDV